MTHNDGTMEVVRLGKSGQISLPKAMLRRLGLAGGALLLVDVTPEGSIILRPAGAFPTELYTGERIKEFRAEDRMTPREGRCVKRQLRPTI